MISAPPPALLVAPLLLEAGALWVLAVVLAAGSGGDEPGAEP